MIDNKINEKKMISIVNKALGISLYKWQIDFMFRHSESMAYGRATGKTLALILRSIMDGETPPNPRYKPKEYLGSMRDYVNYANMYKKTYMQIEEEMNESVRNK